MNSNAQLAEIHKRTFQPDPHTSRLARLARRLRARGARPTDGRGPPAFRCLA